MTLSDNVQQPGRYRIVTEIGRGGMGEVFLAVAHGVAGFTKLVVLKRARPDLAEEPQVLAMFLDEARLAARLNHPNVVQTYEAGQEAGCFFIAMEYLDGQPMHRIRDRIGPRCFPLSMQIRILIEALAGLHHAHELSDFDGTSLGVIHRDATPQNLFVTYDGQIKVVDFGIAKAASSTNKTRAGMIKGKVAYMAPEQTRSERLDRRVDIFTVGVMLWEAIAGERMWKGVANTEIIRRLAAGKLPSLPDEALHNDPELVQICGRALAPVPAERHATAAELQHELERWLARQGEEVTARVVGAFVATHFEKERAAVKAQLEEELRDYSSNSRPKIREADPVLSDADTTMLDSKALARRAALEGAPPAAPGPTALEGAPPAAPGPTALEGAPPAAPDSTAGERMSVEITVTMRSSLPSTSLMDSPPAAPTSARSPQADPAPVSARGDGPLSSAPAPPPPSERHETLGRSSVSVDAAVEPRSTSRLQRRRWKPLVIGSAVLLVGAVAAVALTFGLPLSGNDHLPGMHASAPADEVELSVRVSPATAQIFVDGTPVATGLYKDKLAKDGRTHTIRAEAPNFVAAEESFTANRDVIISLALERKSAGDQ